jgi:hypothetical protein
MQSRSLLLLALPAVAAMLGACGGNTDASIGGNLSGLAAGESIVLQDNGGDNLTLSANGSFEFASRLGAASRYTVTVLTQPTGQLCTVDSGSGSVDSNADSVSTVAVNCVSTSTIGGTVSGLLAGTAVTLGNGDVLLPVAIDGAFAFPGLLAVGANYAVTVATQPAGETCTVLEGSGTVTAGVPVNIAVTCSAP